jgi:hypothetical protein
METMMKRIGVATLVVGGAVVIGSLFLHYVAGASIWHLTNEHPYPLTKRYPIIITVLAIAGAVGAVAGLATKRWWLLIGATLIAAVILGEAFPLLDSSFHLEIGFWLAVVGAVLMLGGGLTATYAAAKGPRQVSTSGSSRTAANAADRTIPVRPGDTRIRNETATDRIATGLVQQMAEVGEPHAAESASSATALAVPPAGWYPDPAESEGERYWSGSEWTTAVRDHGD